MRVIPKDSAVFMHIVGYASVRKWCLAKLDKSKNKLSIQCDLVTTCDAGGLDILSANGLPPSHHRAITWTNTDFLYGATRNISMRKLNKSICISYRIS